MMLFLYLMVHIKMVRADIRRSSRWGGPSLRWPTTRAPVRPSRPCSRYGWTRVTNHTTPSLPSRLRPLWPAATTRPVPAIESTNPIDRTEHQQVAPHRAAGLELLSTALWHLKQEVALCFLAQKASSLVSGVSCKAPASISSPLTTARPHHMMVRRWSWMGGRPSAGARWVTAFPSRRSTRRRSRHVLWRGGVCVCRLRARWCVGNSDCCVPLISFPSVVSTRTNSSSSAPSSWTHPSPTPTPSAATSECARCAFLGRMDRFLGSVAGLMIL